MTQSCAAPPASHRDPTPPGQLEVDGRPPGAALIMSGAGAATRLRRNLKREGRARASLTRRRIQLDGSSGLGIHGKVSRDLPVETALWPGPARTVVHGSGQKILVGLPMMFKFVVTGHTRPGLKLGNRFRRLGTGPDPIELTGRAAVICAG